MAFVALGVAVVVSYLFTRWVRYSSRRLPPGPRPLPFIGNMLDMPTTKPWVTFRNWCNQYGMTIVSYRLT